MADSRKLQYFVAVAEELHFGRAAERLGIAQPPLSRYIKALEEELEAQLFHRGRNSISLTQAGERLYERVTSIFADLEDAELEARRISQGAEGRLRIGFVGSSTYGVLPNVLKSYRLHFPKVSLSLYPMNNAALRRALIRHEIDIGVARPKIDDPDILSVPLITEPLVAAVPDTDPLASRSQLSPDDLRDTPLVLYPEKPRPSFADHVLNICRDAGFEPHNRIFTMDFQTAIALVSIEVGICIVPAPVGDSHRKGVRFVNLAAKGGTTGLSLNYRIDNQAIHLKNFCDIAGRVARRTRGCPPPRTPAGPSGDP